MGLVFVYYTLLPPAVARLLYKWSLATVAGTFSILLSHLLLLDFGDRLWGASGYKPLAEILPVVAAACVAAVLAVVHSGVRRLIHLLPLVLLPVPILVHRTIGLGNSRRMLVAVEYFVYACALLLLLPAFHESLAAFLVRTRANLPHKRFFSIVQLISSHSSEPTAGENATAAARLTAIDENRLRRAVNRTVVSAALFTPIALLVYFVLSRLGLYRCHLFSRATTPSVPLVTSGPVPNNWSEWIANENLSAVTTTSGPISTLPTSPVRNNASSSQQWPFSRVFAFSVALLFESPVSLFAAAATLALMLYALLVATDTLLDRQSHNSNSGRRDSFVKHMRHVGRFDIGLSDLSTPLVYSLIALVFYGFANTSLSSLPAAERSDRMPLLGVWTAVCVVQMLYSAFDFHLQTLPYEKIRQLPKELLINGVLILLLLVSAVFITCNCWPFKSVTFWQQFWGLIILWLLILSLLKSAFGAVSAVCAIYLARSFKKAETVVLCVKLLFQLLLPLFPLWLFIQAVFNKEWNVLTCVTLFTCVVTPINSVWTIARGLWNAWRAIPAPLNGPVLTEDSDPELFEKLHSADQLQCRLCGGSIGEAQINEQEVARSACKHRPHYFHRSCLRMWLIDHSICPICREPQQSSETHIIELIVLAVRQLWSRAFALLLCILTRRLAKVDSPKAPPAQGTAIDISDTTSNVTNTIAADNQKDNRSRKSSEGQE